MGTGQVHRESFEELTNSYFSDINDCYSKDRLKEIVKHYTDIIYIKENPKVEQKIVCSNCKQNKYNSENNIIGFNGACSCMTLPKP